MLLYIFFFFLLNFEKHNCPNIIYLYAGTKPLLFEGPLLLLKKDIAYIQGILDIKNRKRKYQTIHRRVA